MVREVKGKSVGWVVEHRLSFDRVDKRSVLLHRL